jgi:hypothetical protein
MISNKDWTVFIDSESEMCVHVHITDELDISNLEFSLIDEERKVMVKTKVTSREIYLCCNIKKPTFAQLGDCVKYVDGSGTETYYKI